jgi:hypothetical protein
MSTLADLRPGMIGFGPIHGAAGALVNAGQLLLGEGFHVGRLDIRHVFVVTLAREMSENQNHEGEPRRYYGPECVEAMPRGARRALVNDRWTPEYAYVMLPEDYAGQGEDAAAIARAMICTPYSFASYAALAAWRFGMHTPRLEAWIDRRRPDYIDWSAMPEGASMRILANFVRQGRDAESMHLPREVICSVLADQAWALTGKQVMPKGTPHQCVTPGALAQTLLEMEGARWLWPGSTGR